MSLCHIWLGVARSKNRGLPGLRLGRRTTGSMSSSLCKARRTVSGLACMKNQRLSTWAIRLTPQPLLASLRATICWRTGSGSRGDRASPPPRGGDEARNRAASAPPSLRYANTQLLSVFIEMSSNPATSDWVRPSSTHIFTARSRNSGG